MKRSKDVEWARLENVSKIYPAIWTLKDPKVFRLTCELFEAVDPEYLQKALDVTVEDYPLFKSIIRRGLFWYYLERSNIRPEVSVEALGVCAPVYEGLRNTLLFRVFYYGNRINLEVFHALADGAGALKFLQALVCRYFILKNGEKYTGTTLVNDDSSVSGQMDDSFKKYFAGGGRKPRKSKTQKKTSAHKVQGTRLDDNRLILIEGSMSAQDVLKEAHSYDATLTVYLSSLYIYAIGKEMRARKNLRPVVLTVPVDLRQYYESVTARNFFSYVNMSYLFETDKRDLKTVIESMRGHFREDLTVDHLNDQLNRFMSIERNLLTRLVPLPIKDISARIITRLADRQSTTYISNIGRITMPKEFSSDIRQFSICTSASKPQMTLCSYGDRLVVSITSPFRETDIQRTFFQLLTKIGIDIEISSNI